MGLAAVKATNTRLQDHTFLFQGAGEANTGIATLLAMAMEKREGVPFEQALKKLWLKDSRGLIVKNRSKGGITEHKAPFAHEHAEINELEDIVKELKPTVLIGAAGVPRVFTEEIIKDMARFNEVPIIFALSNPTSMAECTAEEAYTHTDGRALFASGSPFPDFHGFGKTYKPGQGNNAYIFPGASLPSLPQAFTTSQTVCSFLRQKLLQIWSLKKISQSAGSTLLSQTSRKFLCRLQRGLLRKHMNRIRHQPIPSPRTRRLSFGLTSTTTTTIRFPTYPAFMHGRRRCKRPKTQT